MAVNYKGEKPGKFWYFRQTMKGLGKTFSDRSYKRQAKAMRRDGFVSAGSIGVAVAAATVKAAAAIPFLVTLGPFIAGGAGLYFGARSYLGYKRLKKSPVVRNHVSDAEQQWLEKKSRLPLFKRIWNAIKKPFTRKPKAATAGTEVKAEKPKKFLFIFNRKAKAPTPQAAPNLTQAPANDVVAHDVVVEEKAPLDPQRAAAAAARAKARQNRPKSRF